MGYVMPKLSERDVKMMKMTCQMEIQLVAERLSLKASTIHSRYDWLRKKRVECQKFINVLNAMEKNCPKLKKLLNPNTLAKDSISELEKNGDS
jgi:hypothetical protein